MVYTVTNQIDSLYIGATKGGQKFLLHSVRADATFSEGLNSVECNVTVKIGELEFGPFSFVHDNIPGGDDDAKQDEDVALPEAD